MARTKRKVVPIYWLDCRRQYPQLVKSTKISFCTLRYTLCHITVKRWFANGLAKATLILGNASLYLDCTVARASFEDQLCKHAEHQR